MKVYVNDLEISLLAGMKVRHALTSAGLLAEVERGAKVLDEWGNEIGLDGSLAEGARIFVGGVSPDRG